MTMSKPKIFLKTSLPQESDWHPSFVGNLLRNPTESLKQVSDYTLYALKRVQDEPNVMVSIEGSKVEFRANENSYSSVHLRATLGVIPTKAQYQIRLTELMLDAANDATPLQMSAATDFLRHLEESSLMDQAPKAMMGATPSGGVTVAWRRDGKRLSVTFLGGEKAMVVRFSPGERVKAKQVERNTVEGVISGCGWIASKPMITSSST